MRRSREAAATQPELEESDVAQLSPEFNQRRTGLSSPEQKRILRALRAEMSWEVATKHLAGTVDASVLERWRPKLLARAAAGDGPVLPDGPKVPERVVPPTLARLYRARDEQVQALADAQREVSELRGAVSDGEAAVRIAAARAAVAGSAKRGVATKARAAAAEARKVLQGAIRAVTDAEVRAEGAAVAVAELDDQIAAAEALHGSDTARRLLERLAGWVAQHETDFLDGLATILALRKARSGGFFNAGEVETHLLAHFGIRVAPSALNQRVAIIEQRFLSTEGDEGGESVVDDQRSRGKARRRGDS